MKNLLFSILLFSIISSCSKENPEAKRNVCVYGVNKLTKKKEYIMCTHYEINLCSTNQECANKVAEKYSLPYVNISVKNNYTNITTTASTDCNCKP